MRTRLSFASVAVLVAGEHLERPEPQEEHREDGERDEAEDRDAQGELRRQAVGLLDARVGGQEARAICARSAKQPHLVDAVERARAGGKSRRANAVHGPGQDQVEEHGRREPGEHRAGGRGLAEHEVQRERAERVEDGDHRDRGERRVEAVARGRLAVAPDPEAGEGEQRAR